MDIVQKCTGTVRPGSQHVSGGIESAILVTIFEKRGGYQCTRTKAPNRRDITVKEKGMTFERFCATSGTPFTGETDRYDLSCKSIFRIFANGLLFEEQLVYPGLNGQ
jgi:hypothetical protein